MNTFAHCFTQKNHHDNNETKYTQMQQQTKQTNRIPMPKRNETKIKHAHLSTLWPPNRKHEEGGGVGIPLHSEIGKGGSMALDRLTDLALHRIQLHGSHNTVLLHNKGRQSEQLVPQHGFAAQQRQSELLHHATQFCCTTK